jgi:hypothetical protein
MTARIVTVVKFALIKPFSFYSFSLSHRRRFIFYPTNYGTIFLYDEHHYVYFYGGYSLPKIQSLKLDNVYFGSTKQVTRNLIADPRITYCTGI